MTVYGYSRVSTEEQNDISQIEELKKYGVDEIINEKITGVSDDRKLVDLVENKIKEGDMLVVLDVTRFGRSTLQSIMLAQKINEKKANLVIKNLGVDTRTPGGQLVFNVMVSMAEFERLQSKERQRRGIENARKNGVHIGRPRTWKKGQMAEAVRQYKETNKTVNEICDSTGVTRASLYRELAKLGVKR